MKRYGAIYYLWDEFENFLKEKAFVGKSVRLAEDEHYYCYVVVNDEVLDDEDFVIGLGKALNEDVCQTVVDENGVWVIFR